MPPNTVNVSRPGKFGNPYKVTEDRSQTDAVAAFRLWLMVDNYNAGKAAEKQQILLALHELKGKDLACWCREGAPCHADVLLELANS